MFDKTGILKENVNISESFSLFDASYGAFNGGSVGHTKVIETLRYIERANHGCRMCPASVARGNVWKIWLHFYNTADPIHKCMYSTKCQ